MLLASATALMAVCTLAGIDAGADANHYRDLPGTRRFDFPVGPPDAAGFFNAQGFGENFHLGDDWNGIGPPEADRGAPVQSSADGLVTYAENAQQGWGNVVRVVHHVRERNRSHWVETVYAHLDTVHVRAGDYVYRGERVGTIGDADGRYEPHLHFEIRSVPDLPLGPGYSVDDAGWMDPTAFIQAHR